MKPKSLKLEFSKAADYKRINALFDSAIKQKIDPKGYVVKRIAPAFRDAAAKGAIGLLSSEKGDVVTMTAAYRVRLPRPAFVKDTKQHDYVEMGTSLATLPGYGSAKLIVAALALKEWWEHPPRYAMTAEIKEENIASVITYRDRLGWQKVTDWVQAVKITKATDTTLADEKDKTSGIGVPKGAVWYQCTNDTLAIQARILLEFMDQGGLINKKTGHHIPVDFTALATAGLTHKRLQAIAGGTTKKAALHRII